MDTSYPIFVENKASHDILYLLGLGKNGTPIYPDTSLPQINPFGDTVISTVTGEKSRAFESRGPWEGLFSSLLPADTFSAFIFHADTIKKYSWEEIRRDYKVLKRYDLSLEELERINYVITYP